jgi:hypothetical protein
MHMLFAFAAVILGQSAKRPLASFLWSRSAAVIAAALTLCAASRADDIVDFRPSSQAGSFRQAKVTVEVEGKLKLNADGQELKHLPLKVQGELHYAERVLSQAKQWSDVRLLRSYQTAQATIQLNQSDVKSALRPERRLVAIDSTSKRTIA